MPVLPGGGTVPLLTRPAHPLPNPAINNKPQKPIATRLVRRLLAFSNPPISKIRTRNLGSAVGGAVRRVGSSQERAVVVMEIDTEEALVPFGVTEEGLTVHTESAGAPLHDSATA